MQGRAVSRAELAIHVRRETKIKEHLLDLPIDHLFAVRVFFTVSRFMNSLIIMMTGMVLIRIIQADMGGSVAEWLACWTQAQKGPGSNRSRDSVV